MSIDSKLNMFRIEQAHMIGNLGLRMRMGINTSSSSRSIYHSIHNFIEKINKYKQVTRGIRMLFVVWCQNYTFKHILITSIIPCPISYSNIYCIDRDASASIKPLATSSHFCFMFCIHLHIYTKCTCSMLDGESQITIFI